MYEEFFQLKGKPFSKTPDPGFLYESPLHAEALARLELAVEDRELAVLLGDIGSGKTTLTRALVDRLEGSITPVLITNPKVTPVQLLRIIAGRIGIGDTPRNRVEVHERISDRLYQLHVQSTPVVLIIDEAQLIASKATFDEIRLLTNFQLDDTNLMAVILAGQPELASRISKPPYEAFCQRIGLTCRLSPLCREDITKYVEHRLRVAGAESNLFSTEALDLLYKHSGGIPRLLNSIAHNAMIDAFSRDESTINVHNIQSAISGRIDTKGHKAVSNSGEVRH